MERIVVFESLRWVGAETRLRYFRPAGEAERGAQGDPNPQVLLRQNAGLIVDDFKKGARSCSKASTILCGQLMLIWISQILKTYITPSAFLTQTQGISNNDLGVWGDKLLHFPLMNTSLASAAKAWHKLVAQADNSRTTI